LLLRSITTEWMQPFLFRRQRSGSANPPPPNSFCRGKVPARQHSFQPHVGTAHLSPQGGTVTLRRIILFCRIRIIFLPVIRHFAAGKTRELFTLERGAPFLFLRSLHLPGRETSIAPHFLSVYVEGILPPVSECQSFPQSPHSPPLEGAQFPHDRLAPSTSPARLFNLPPHLRWLSLSSPVMQRSCRQILGSPPPFSRITVLGRALTRVSFHPSLGV